MKILACVKQVPDAEQNLVIESETAWITTKKISFRMNRFDEYAVEEALRIREDVPNCTIDAVTAGPPRSESVVRRAMEMGADNGIHIITENEGFVSPAETAGMLWSWASKAGYDLILCGIMSEDFMQSAVGPMLASLAGLPCLSAVIDIEVATDGTSVKVEREMEGGARERYSVALPALVTVQSGINRPRYPSLSNVLRAKKQIITTLFSRDLPPKTSGLTVDSVSLPHGSRNTEFLEGTPAEKATAFIRLMREKSFL